MKWIYNFITGIIGNLYRDIVVLFSGEYAEYLINNGYFVYKNIVPINITIGLYKFVKSSEYYLLSSDIKVN